MGDGTFGTVSPLCLLITQRPALPLLLLLLHLFLHLLMVYIKLLYQSISLRKTPRSCRHRSGRAPPDQYPSCIEQTDTPIPTPPVPTFAWRCFVTASSLQTIQTWNRSKAKRMFIHPSCQIEQKVASAADALHGPCLLHSLPCYLYSVFQNVYIHTHTNNIYTYI